MDFFSTCRCAQNFVDFCRVTVNDGQVKRPVHVNIHRMRLAAGLTQQQLADAIGVDKSSVSHWETGKGAPSLRHLPKVALTLRTTTDALLSSHR